MKFMGTKSRVKTDIETWLKMGSTKQFEVTKPDEISYRKKSGSYLRRDRRKIKKKLSLINNEPTLS